ncbi:hypothetical protein AVEN_186162-1 [Araneus ventricosus]|uniref:Uncharacterized protein n=1 Tax=Araneus ventricosus TaxID=182803 RepID=A0A4Y2GFC7_ARAVE|nr:hypothetical protein AVEN_186162-1 [Araneus ventricosus]
MLKTIDTDMTPFPHLNWKMILKVSSPLVSSEAELQNIKASPAVFGVWGKEKWEYFSEFLDNVWDVSSDPYSHTNIEQYLHYNGQCWNILIRRLSLFNAILAKNRQEP